MHLLGNPSIMIHPWNTESFSDRNSAPLGDSIRHNGKHHARRMCGDIVAYYRDGCQAVRLDLQSPAAHVIVVALNHNRDAHKHCTPQRLSLCRSYRHEVEHASPRGTRSVSRLVGTLGQLQFQKSSARVEISSNWPSSRPTVCDNLQRSRGSGEAGACSMHDLTLDVMLG